MVKGAHGPLMVFLCSGIPLLLSLPCSFYQLFKAKFYDVDKEWYIT